MDRRVLVGMVAQQMFAPRRVLFDLCLDEIPKIFYSERNGVSVFDLVS